MFDLAVEFVALCVGWPIRRAYSAIYRVLDRLCVPLEAIEHRKRPVVPILVLDAN